MQNVCFLNGHLILREHKTGVHVLHEIVTKKLLKIERNYNIVVGYFRNSSTNAEIKKDVYEWIEPCCKSRSSWMRIFSYLLPIEFFFGINDVYFCDGFFPITLHKSKRICLVHDLMVKIYPENYSLIRRIYLNLFFRKLPKADLVLCVSESTKEDIIKYFNLDPDKILVCYSGIDSPKKYKLDSNIIQNVDLNAKYIFYIGDMRPNKNLYNTVKAFLTFIEEEEIKDLYFFIAGKKDGDFSIIREITQNSKYGNHIIFLGYVDEMQKHNLYEHSIAVILVSQYEGFGLPIIEGMQHYKPIITSNISSMKEIGEGTALFANPNNITSISEAIKVVYEKRIVVDKEEYNKKLTRFSFDNVACVINQAIEKCLKQSGSA